MQNIFIEKPYKFVPRFKPKWPQRLLVRSGLLERILRKREGVIDYEIRHLHRLKDSLAAGHGIMSTPNHPRTADPIVMQTVSRSLNCPFYTMASWHLFNQNLPMRLVLRWMGGFSINREGLDRRAIDEAIEILQAAERPLVIFPEGTTSRTNDRLMAFMEGPSFIGRTAAKRRAKNDGGKVVCHPIAIKYVFGGDLELAADAVLSDIESRLTWRPQTDIPLIDRLGKVGDTLLALKELEFGIKPDREKSLRQRQTSMVNHLLNPLESEWLNGPREADGIAVRVKNLNTQIFPEMSRDQLEPGERERRRRQMQDIFLAQKIDCYPEGYIVEFPSVDRILETVEKFDENLTGHIRVHGNFKAIIEIGDAIEVATKRDKTANEDPLIAETKQSIGSMLDLLKDESRMYVAVDPTDRASSGGFDQNGPNDPNNESDEVAGGPIETTGEDDIKKGLFNKGFISLLAVSFFGAANDNILKTILTYMVVLGGLWSNRLGAGSQGAISLVLTIPFIILSGFSGQIADKFSKQRVILLVKIAEIPIAIFAMCGLLFGSFWLSLTALFLLAVQSSFYGPAKFGIIPDLVDSHRLSQANGLINALSNVAVILGSLAAGPLADLYYPTIQRHEINESVSLAGTTVSASQVTQPSVAEPSEPDNENRLVRDPSRQEQRLPIGVALVFVSCMGLVAVMMMPKMKPVDPDLKLSFDFLGPHIQTFKDANRPLIVVMFSWSGFYLIGALALLLIPDYRAILGVSYTEIGYLTGVLAVAIVIGSCTVGFLSGKTIRPYLALFGAVGMTICFAIMGMATLTYIRLATLMFCVGFFAGFYIVPLQALLQFLSPADERGRFFGTANALSFTFISMAGVIFFALRTNGVPTERMPLVCAGLALVGTLVGMVELNRIMTAQKITRIALDHAEYAESTGSDR